MVTIHYAKTHLSKLIERVRAGETIIIARNKEPVATLAPLPKEKKSRKSGFLKGRIWYTDDAFDPLTDEEMKDWEAPLNL